MAHRLLKDALEELVNVEASPEQLGNILAHALADAAKLWLPALRAKDLLQAAGFALIDELERF